MKLGYYLILKEVEKCQLSVFKSSNGIEIYKGVLMLSCHYISYIQHRVFSIPTVLWGCTVL